MNRRIRIALCALAWIPLWVVEAHARGGMGGFRGGGFRGGAAAGGFRGGGYAGGFRGGAVGGYRGGGYAGGFREGGAVGGYRGGYAGGFREGGYAGGFREGGAVGGFREGGAVGGFREGGYAGGVREGGAVGGFREGGAVAGFGAGGGREGGYAGGVREGGAAGFREGGAVGGFREGGGAGGFARHEGLPTDFGFGRYGGIGAAGGFVAAGHATRFVAPGALAARGVDVRGRFSHYDLFRGGWYGAHPGAWMAAGWGAATAWGWATWPQLDGWLGWAAPQPYYYDFGNTVTYQGDQVYSGGQPVATADQYYSQAQSLAQANPQAEQPTDQWQPLGVFSMVQGEQADSNVIFQLAVNKAGVIRGNYYNALTNTTMPLRGTTDKTTQRVAWTVGDNKDVVYDLGLYSLTKDEAPILVHIGKDRTQQWDLVRIKNNESQAAPG